MGEESLVARLRAHADDAENMARGALDNPYDGTDMAFHNACMSLAKDLREAADALERAEKALGQAALELDEASKIIGGSVGPAAASLFVRASEKLRALSPCSAVTVRRLISGSTWWGRV